MTVVPLTTDPIRSSKTPPQKKDDIHSSFCAVCRCNDKRLKRCQRCRSVQYCSVQCQTIDWRTHRPFCGKKKERNTNAAPAIIIQQSYQELLQLIHTKSLPELQQEYHQVSDHIQSTSVDDVKDATTKTMTTKSSVTPPILSPASEPSISTDASLSVSSPIPTNSTLPAEMVEWKWSLEHLSHVHRLQFILERPKAHVPIHPDRLQLFWIHDDDSSLSVRLVVAYHVDDELPTTRLSIELPVHWAPKEEEEPTIQCLDANRSIMIRWSYSSNPALSPFDGDDDDHFRPSQRPNILACRHCHTSIAHVRNGQKKETSPGDNAPDTITDASLSPPLIDTCLSLPSEAFHELHEYLVCYNDGPTSMDGWWNAPAAAMVPPACTMYENETLYVLHSENVVPDALCHLAIPSYGARDENGTEEDDRPVAIAHSKWLLGQPWLCGSLEWQAISTTHRPMELEAQNAWPEDVSTAPSVSVTNAVTCSFCASVLGFATSKSVVTASWGMDEGDASAVLSYQLLKHQLVSMGAVRAENDTEAVYKAVTADSTHTTSNNPIAKAPSLVPLGKRNSLAFQNVLSISQFIIYEMIRFAKSNAIFTFAVICVEEDTRPLPSSKEEEIQEIDTEAPPSVTTSVLRLRLFHWNTKVASSENSDIKTLAFVDNHHDSAAPTLPIDDVYQAASAATTETVHLPRWNRQVKVLFEANVYTTPLGRNESGEHKIGKKSTSFEKARASVPTKKRQDWCCRSPVFFGMPPFMEPTSRADEISSSVVRVYLSHSDWNQLHKELCCHQPPVGEQQSQLLSALIPTPGGSNDDTKVPLLNTATSRSLRSGVSFVIIP